MEGIIALIYQVILSVVAAARSTAATESKAPCKTSVIKNAARHSLDALMKTPGRAVLETASWDPSTALPSLRDGKLRSG